MATAAPGGTQFGTVVVGTDGSTTAAAAVSQAIALSLAPGARLHIVSVYEPPIDRSASERTRVPEEIEWSIGPHADVLALLEQAERDARGAGVREVETFARQGDAAEAILDVAEEQRADLIVVGNKGLTGAERFLLGSVPNRVAHHAPCSVLIVRTS
jgi:nucleotide-binding universal stress UspA family protein